MVLKLGIYELTTIIVLFYILFKLFFYYSHKYWERKNVPYITPTIPFGNSDNPFNKTLSNSLRMQEFYNYFKSKGYKHGGIYRLHAPRYIPLDPEYIKSIMMTDFQHFVDRDFYHNEKDDPLSAHLFAIGGPKWRKLRTKLSPTFTSGKMKMMFGMVEVCCSHLDEAILKMCKNNEPVNIKDMLNCYTTDCIGSCAFGLDCSSFKEGESSEFIRFSKNILIIPKMQYFKNLVCFTVPELARTLGFNLLPKHLSKFFSDTIKDTIEYRKENNVARNDFLQLLINLMDVEGKDDQKFTFDEIAAQSFVFFLAGFETSSTLMTFSMFEMAINPDIQQRVRDEIESVTEGTDGTFTYDLLSKMTYLEQVMNESLRKYPPIAVLSRKCVKDYVIPGTDIVLEKGVGITLPVYAYHHDPDFFPDPEKFDPERFSEENKRKIVPFTFIPFGEGPRMCIGLRFGMMQSKMALATFVKHYKFSLNPKTILPLEIHPFTFALGTKNPILLDFEEIPSDKPSPAQASAAL